MFRFSRLIALAVVLLFAAGLAFVLDSAVSPKPSAPDQLASQLWSSYLRNQWLNEGRTVSDPHSSVTTSEAQGYTLLRAVWVNDQTVFAKTWAWTKSNLQQKNGLFAWEWGRRANGSYGIITADNGQNTAADGDCNIALALLMAGKRWNNTAYSVAGKNIVKAIWNIEVVQVHGVYYLAADNLEKTATAPQIVINPSYFFPAAFKVFAQYDKQNDWNKLASDSIDTIKQLSNMNLGGGKSVGLPPDWAVVDRRSGVLASSSNGQLDTSFGYNAFRTAWNLALDYQWFHDQMAQQALRGFGFLSGQWKAHHSLLAVYSHSGVPQVNYSSLALYGGTLSYFQYNQPREAEAIISGQLIAPLLGNRRLKRSVNYYDNNWVWFGIQLYDHNLPNLAGGS